MLSQSAYIHSKLKREGYVLHGRVGKTNLGGAGGGDIMA